MGIEVAIAALIAAGATITAAIISAVAKNASEGQARALLEQAKNEYGQIDIPKLEQLAGAALPPTELAKIKQDPQYRDAQIAALDKLQELGSATGPTLQDQAMLNAAMGKVSRAESAGREAIRENMAARGILGSGAELAMSLDSHQDAANKANLVGMDMAGKAQARAYDAILQRGNLAGQMSQQDMAHKTRVAQAQDAINRYNGTRYQNAAQQHFANQLALQNGKNGVTGQMVQSAMREGQNNANIAAGAGAGVSQAASAYGDYASNTRQYDTSSVDRPVGPTDDELEAMLERARNRGA